MSCGRFAGAEAPTFTPETNYAAAPSRQGTGATAPMNERTAYDMAVPKQVQEQVEKVQRGVQGFADDMREAGIHVGLGSPGRCVTCGQAWPCEGSGIK